MFSLISKNFVQNSRSVSQFVKFGSKSLPIDAISSRSLFGQKKESDKPAEKSEPVKEPTKAVFNPCAPTTKGTSLCGGSQIDPLKPVNPCVPQPPPEKEKPKKLEENIPEEQLKELCKRFEEKIKEFTKDEKKTDPAEKEESKDKSTVKFNMCIEVENAINGQINKEMEAFYDYLAKYSYFSRPEIGLQGSAQFFMEMANEEKQHAWMLVNYLNIRGGSVKLQPINTPSKQEFKNLLDALQDSLELEMKQADNLCEVQKTADKRGDSATSDFILANLLRKQLESIGELNYLIARLKLFQEDKNLGVVMFDSELSKKFGEME